jgi:nitrate/nitrite transport system ATP-binding protein
MITNNVDEAILLADRIVPILPGPPATLGTPIAVTLPRPRDAAQLSHDDEAARVRAHVITTLTEAVSGTARTRRAAATLRQHAGKTSDMTIPVAEEAR